MTQIVPELQSETTNSSPRGRLVLRLYIALFLILFGTPGGVTLLRTLRGRQIQGVQVFPSFTLSRWMDGSFQKQFEEWYDENFAMRNFYVRTSNQINLSCFHEITFKDRAQITLGNRNSLFRSKYIHSYYGRDTMPPKVVEKFAADLKKVQDRLRGRGVAFLFLITPSKPSIYPEDIPENLRSPSGEPRPSNYDLLVPLLAKYGVETLDGRQLSKSLRESCPYPLFPKSGFHWNYYGSLRVMQELILRLETLTHRRLRHLRIDQVRMQLRPIGSDGDAVQLAQLWTPGAFWEMNPYPEVVREDVPGSIVPNVLLVGDSFMSLPLHWLVDLGVASGASAHNWYFKDPIKDIVREIESRNVVVLGMNEALLQWRGYGLIESVLTGTYQAYPMKVE